MNLEILDTTFRDGVQGRGIEVTNIDDAMHAIRAIDDLGVKYLELGFASSNFSAQERIRKALELDLNAKVAAFGRTHATDVGAILDLKVPVGVLVGKVRLRDVEKSLLKTAQENLDLIRESIKKLVENNIEVIFDAEHYFQAFFEDDREYALKVLKLAWDCGVTRLVLCDTNGKMTPEKVAEAIAETAKHVPMEMLGIHTHNDRGRALANAEAAWVAGVRHIQGVVGGFGERTGNLDLMTLIPNLCLDHEAQGFGEEKLAKLKDVYLQVCDCVNTVPDAKKPYVGDAAFYTEAGMHESGQQRDPGSYLHADPAMFGNFATTGITEQSGKSNLLSKAQELAIEIPEDKVSEIAKNYQNLVDEGINFGLADASFHLFLIKELGSLPEYFKVNMWQILNKQESGEGSECVASLKINIHGQEKWLNASGDGPVNALDNVLRQSLNGYTEKIDHLKLVDFSVRTVDAFRGTAAKVRVLIQFSDGQHTWETVGVKENIEEASWEALLSGYIYKLAVIEKLA